MKMPSIPLAPDMKTVGCVCPNLQRFAAEAIPPFVSILARVIR